MKGPACLRCGRGLDKGYCYPSAAWLARNPADLGVGGHTTDPELTSHTARHDASTMKKRSEVKKPKMVLHCADCGAEQFDTPSGMVCKNEHGGAASISAAEAFAIFPSRETVVPENAQPPAKKRRTARDVVDNATRELAQAIDEEGAKAAGTVPDPLKWSSANEAKEANLDPAFVKIMETLVVDDPAGCYEQLERILVIGDKRTDYGTVTKHLDEAEHNARLAHRLWQAAIIERKRWELENEVVFGAMRREATRSLQHEKDSGSRSKQITDADVESRVSTMYPDEYSAQERKRVRVKSMVDSMQNLSDMWASRCKSLQTILSKQR